MKLHAKYQRPGPSCFRRGFLKFFPLSVYVKQMTPGAGPFLTLGL